MYHSTWTPAAMVTCLKAASHRSVHFLSCLFSPNKKSENVEVGEQMKKLQS